MVQKKDISIAIVLYKENPKILQKTIDSVLQISLTKHLFLIDNSPTNNLQSLANHPDTSYIKNERNIGFGAANNLIKNQTEITSTFHLVLNPDVVFEPDTIVKLIHRLKAYQEVMMIAPRVVFPNGSHQFTIRKYPTFFDLIIRKLTIFKNRIHDKEYRNEEVTKPFFPEVIHGCFMLFKTEDFLKIGGFDERYFLYMEDVDLCKKIDAYGKQKMYDPSVSVSHVLMKGSSKEMKLFFYHLSSAIKYFLKW